MSGKNRSAELVRLSYCSTATFASMEGSAGVEKEVARILMESRRNNPPQELGGVLHYGNGYFFQVLEGERKKVNDRYEKIVNDSRHRDVELLAVHPVEERLFPDWSMKYVAVEESIGKLLAEEDFKEFNPYEFDENFCERLIRCFVKEPDAPLAPETDEKQRRPFWKRLFG